LDHQFIAISTCYNESRGINFFSKKLLDLHWQKTFEKNVIDDFAYGNGLLLLLVSKEESQSGETGSIQVYDVTSKTYFARNAV
jgi:hypothetical protein